MKRTIIYSAICFALLSSCSKQIPDGTSDKTTEVTFDMGTRANGDGTQKDRDTYSILCYSGSNTLLTNTDQRGYYGYDATRPNSLIPIPTNRTPYDNFPNYPDAKGDPSGALRLNQGTYKVAVMHPAVPVNNSTIPAVGTAAVFQRGEVVYASDPNDYTGEGGGEFAIKILADMNFHVFPFPTDNGQLKMYPINSAIEVFFYSSNSVPFTIAYGSDTGIKLMNAGTYGWYNPNTKKTYPSFATTPGSFNFDNSGSLGDQLDLKEVGISQPATITSTIKYWLDTELVLPSDYTGDDPLIRPLALRVPITMGASTITSDIPLKIKIDRRKKYTFYINVTSEMYTVQYTVNNWDAGTASDPGTPIGNGELLTLGSFAITSSGDWNPGGTDNGNIGN